MSGSGAVLSLEGQLRDLHAVLLAEDILYNERLRMALRRVVKQILECSVGTGKGNVAVSLALHGYRVLTGEPEEDDSEYAKQEWH